MELLIVSGLSGAGKSVAMNALEDIGFFCIDNVPAGLLPSITAFSEAGDSQLERVALSMDVRGCRTSEEIERALDKLDEQGVDYKILFLDAPDDVLMRRYSETRRRHPISIAEGISTREAFAKERKILKPLQERADYVINTALLSTAQNKERICDLFAKNGGAKGAMRLTVMSFGFKFGIPPEADLVLDVRCLPNPFYVPELKHKTGLDQDVVDFVMSHPEAQELLKRYENFLQYALPLYVKEGKSQLTIAVDIDPVAVRTAGENAALNGVQDKLTVLVGDLSDKASGKYDIITANIVANAILSLAPAVPGLMAEDATFIASGIIDSRKDEVIAGLEKAGLAVVEVKEKRGWECIVCKKA